MTSLASNYITVKNAKMHYLREGKGKPLLFIHGMPTSSYIWRNIIPELSKYADCIALDLIGMGKSDKPDISYSVHDHIDYLKGFIDALGLKNVNLVMHGWGSVIGLTYAVYDEKNVASVAVIEGYVHMPAAKNLPLPVLELAHMAKDQKKLEHMIMEENYFLNKLMPDITLKKLSEEDLAVYQKPFEKKENRKVLYRFMLDQPYYNQNSIERKLIDNFSDWLQRSTIPKLLMYGVPGFLMPMSSVEWALDHLPNLTVVEVGEGLHYLPETCPKEIAQTLSGWV